MNGNTVLAGLEFSPPARRQEADRMFDSGFSGFQRQGLGPRGLGFKILPFGFLGFGGVGSS